MSLVGIRDTLAGAVSELERLIESGGLTVAPSADWPPLPVPHPVWGINVKGPFGPHGVMHWRNKRQNVYGRWNSTFGTYWPFRGGFVTAAHVHEKNEGAVPPFARGEVISRPGSDVLEYVDADHRLQHGYDVTFIGCDLAGDPPSALERNLPVLVEGVVGGAHRLLAYRGTAFAPRADHGVTPTFILRLEDAAYEVMGGFSGALVSAPTSDGRAWEPVGIAAESAGGNVDTDQDGDVDEHLDIVPLCEAFLAAQREVGVLA